MTDQGVKLPAVEDGLAAVRAELMRAMAKFPAFNSPHEGWAVIKEELDELWAEVRAKNYDHGRARQEAIQVAAMALRYVVDLTGGRP